MSELNGLSSTTAVEGYGTVEWTIRDLFGTTRTIRTEAYYVPQATIRLFSPQAYFQETNAGQYLMTAQRSVLTLADGSKLEFPYNPGSNLPLMLPSVNQAVAGLTFEDRNYLTQPNLLSSFLSVADETNQNLTASQKELLLWHWKLGHAGFQWIQHLASTPHEPIDGIEYPILKCKQPRVSSCPAPLCTACQLSKQNRRGAGTSLELTTRTKTNYSDAMMNFTLDGKCRLTNMFLPFLVVCLIPKAKSPPRTSLMAAQSLLIMHPPTFI
jgi:hypothetical protein